ncbi:hypothetical protein D9Q98_006197 [Chlorella vulgaris]|uniref:Mediator of RNA polymerase II transcription subunit 25 n=1 Tax=Chlorella vulgaris TaxID=3077 RepID=A0A9D4Z145_CHLVU|nr:hypothetical protein D9Q98_006197 [Chlorella vulgaris]
MASTAPSLRLCLAVECGARMAPLWQALLHGMIEPILAHYGPSLELALVLFGAHPPHSLAAVESSIGWTSDADEQQRLLGDAQFIGGGGSSPVALAEALLEVAALFAIADASPDAAAPQQHCLVCITSDPAVHPVPWPCAEDCDMANLPGLATSAELIRALPRRGIQLGWAGNSFLQSPSLLWHVANLVSEQPLSLSDARLEVLKQHQEGTLQQLFRLAVSVPGGATAVLPTWPLALKVLLRAGAKQLTLSAALAAGSSTHLGAELGGASEGLALAVDSPDARAQLLDEPAAKRARLNNSTAALGSAAAASAGTGMPGTAPLQWTSPGGGGQPTPPHVAGAASPGSFMDIMAAEICTPAMVSPGVDQPSPLGDQMMATMMQQAAPPALPPPAVHQPSVAGLPIPPVHHEQHQQHQQFMHSGGPAAGLGGGPGPASVPLGGGGGEQYALVHTGTVVVDPKVTRGTSLLLGMGQVRALPQQAATLQAMPWPSELRISKNVAVSDAHAFIKSKQGCIHTRLKIAYSSQEGAGFLERQMHLRAAGILSLHANMLAVLLPFQHPGTREVLLRLVLVPTGSSGGG